MISSHKHVVRKCRSSETQRIKDHSVGHSHVGVIRVTLKIGVSWCPGDKGTCDWVTAGCVLLRIKDHSVGHSHVGVIRATQKIGVFWGPEDKGPFCKWLDRRAQLLDTHLLATRVVALWIISDISIFILFLTACSMQGKIQTLTVLWKMCGSTWICKGVEEKDESLRCRVENMYCLETISQWQCFQWKGGGWEKGSEKLCMMNWSEGNLTTFLLSHNKAWKCDWYSCRFD